MKLPVTSNFDQLKCAEVFGDGGSGSSLFIPGQWNSATLATCRIHSSIKPIDGPSQPPQYSVDRSTFTEEKSSITWPHQEAWEPYAAWTPNRYVKKYAE